METKTHQHLVRVRVFAQSKKDRFIVHEPDSFDVYVREPAQRNLANFRVRELVGEHFGVGVENVSIQTGHRSPKKTLLVRV